MKQFLKFLAILLAGIAFAIYVAIFMPLPIEGATTPTAVIIGTTPTTHTIYMVDWEVLISVYQAKHKALDKIIREQIAIKSDSFSSSREKELAVDLIVKSQCQKEALVEFLSELSNHDMLEIFPSASDYGVWRRNPLKE